MAFGRVTLSFVVLVRGVLRIFGMGRSFSLCATALALPLWEFLGSCGGGRCVMQGEAED